jgi:deoxyribonuclease V
MSPLPLLACVDVDYRGAGAVAAAILFLDWSSPFALEEHRVTVDEVAPYRPGAFYERELPCILAVLRRSRGPIGVVVVDGYVWLGDQRPGLGAHLHAALGGEIAVIGVAKSLFPGAPATPLLRGDSQRPLYVSATGVDLASAADNIRRMHGPHRLPTLLKQVDGLCRAG